MAGHRSAFVPVAPAEGKLRAQLADLEGKERVPFYRTWKGIVLSLVAALAIITIDFTRRESCEATGRIVSTRGMVWVTPVGQTVTYNVDGVTLGPGDVVATGNNAAAVVWLAGGVTVALEPQTTFSIRVLEYDRKLRTRDQSFMLHSGRVWGQAPADFGAESRLDICTPSTIATVYPGTRFSLSYDPRTRVSRLRGLGGHIDFITARQRLKVQGHSAALANWHVMGQHEALTIQQLEQAAQYERYLAQFQQTPSWLWRMERNIADAVYTPLGWIGLGPKSWIDRSFDTAARSRATQAMHRLHNHLVDTLSDGAPDFPEQLNLITLEELRLPEGERSQILLSLAGNRLELYQQFGRGYRLTAFAKDHARTAYEINSRGKVERVERRRARTLLIYEGVSSEM